jgi:cytochrome c-type biogenesis protein CcmF
LVLALSGTRHWGAVLVVTLAAFVISAVLRHLWWLARRSASGTRRSLPAAAWNLMLRDGGYWGGQIAHIGVALVAVAITASFVFADRGEVSLRPGEMATFAGYELFYETPFSRSEENREVVGAAVVLSRDGNRLQRLTPAINTYRGRGQAVPSPDFRIGLADDLYISLTRIDSGGITLDVFRNPMMWLLWAGGFLVVVGASWPLIAKRRSDAAAKERIRA